MSLFEDVHSVQGAPALAVLLALLVMGGGGVGLAELMASPAVLLALVVIIGATYGQ